MFKSISRAFGLFLLAFVVSCCFNVSMATADGIARNSVVAHMEAAGSLDASSLAEPDQFRWKSESDGTVCRKVVRPVPGFRQTSRLNDWRSSYNNNAGQNNRYDDVYVTVTVTNEATGEQVGDSAWYPVDPGTYRTKRGAMTATYNGGLTFNCRPVRHAKHGKNNQASTSSNPDGSTSDYTYSSDSVAASVDVFTGPGELGEAVIERSKYRGNGKGPKPVKGKGQKG